MTRRKLNAQNILTMNKKAMFLFIGDCKGRKYFTTYKFHTKIFNSEFFQTTVYSVLQWLEEQFHKSSPHTECTKWVKTELSEILLMKQE